MRPNFGRSGGFRVVGALMRVADRHFLIERGKVVWSGNSSELAAAPDVQHRYLGV
jgi:branched-chain amino acid transport system ATP-binding protein